MKKINLVLSGILFVMFVNLVSIFGFGLVAACDEGEMQTMMTGNVIGGNLNNNINLGVLSLIKELLIVVVLLLLIIYLIKLIGKK